MLVTGQCNQVHLSKFADDNKVHVAVGTLEGRDDIWRDLDRLERETYAAAFRKITIVPVAPGAKTEVALYSRVKLFFMTRSSCINSSAFSFSNNFEAAKFWFKDAVFVI